MSKNKNILLDEFKTGMKVRIKNALGRPSHWNSSGRMDKYKGRVVTICDVYLSRNLPLTIEEDEEFEVRGKRWKWKATDFERAYEVDMSDVDDLFEI